MSENVGQGRQSYIYKMEMGNKPHVEGTGLIALYVVSCIYALG
jgi:hypothetical protein